ncbi:MAG: alkaline phosphatase D family protein [Akkermansiaceae bacterium]|nr:alkaline phosphatase D family protein [Akkermansiaceae bacterium]
MKFLFALLSWIAAAHLQAADTLKILLWNTERGSNPYGPGGKERVLKVVRDSGADVVLWQESYPLGEDGPKLSAWVAKELGWQAWQGESPHLAVATRFQIAETYFHHPWHGVGARLRDDAGREFLAWSIWLDWRSPVQWLAQDRPDATDAGLLACDTGTSDRFAQAQALLDGLDAMGHLEADVPLLVGGDWNSSSHRDWTAEAVAAHPWRRDLPLMVSRLVEGAGFTDAFRFVHPSVAKAPGNTWTPRQDKRDNGKDDPPERIDRLYFRNVSEKPGLVPVKTTVLPRNREDAAGPKESAVFPSDHSAVLIEFEWRSGERPAVDDATAVSPGLDHAPPGVEQPDFEPTRIAWGSCYRESQPCPMLATLGRMKPDLYLALGDNIYGDTQDMAVLRRKYRRLGRQPDWRDFVRDTPVLATWDDHDYGADDSGRQFRPKQASKDLFLDFFDEPADSPRRSREGIYRSTLLGPPERRIQILMLDLRTFRSPIARAEEKAYPELGRYRPLLDDEEQVMLGDAQWTWLEEELKKPAKLRLIGLSTQFGSAHNGHEAWANLPRERERFLQLLRNTRAEGVILLSGDTHWAEYSLIERPDLYPLPDLTSSSLNQSWKPAGPNPNRIGRAYTDPNAAILEIDWEKETVTSRTYDVSGKVRLMLEIPLASLRFETAVSEVAPEGAWETSFGTLTLEETSDGWRGTYPGGSCELQQKGGTLEGIWSEDGRSGKCRFQPTRCGRFLLGAYGRGDGPLALPWPAWRRGGAGFAFPD